MNTIGGKADREISKFLEIDTLITKEDINLIVRKLKLSTITHF